MINLATLPDENLSQTMRLLKVQIVSRGWHAELPYERSAHCYIDRGDGVKLHIYSATPPTTSYASAHLANDKYATHQVLEAAGLPQLDSMLVSDSAPLSKQQLFLDAHSIIVVKPADGGHGKGITVDVRTDAQLQSALKEARAFTKSLGGVILQRQYPHPSMRDIRILCIDYQYIAATWRVPARIVGDGIHTIRGLIKKENARERRGVAYYAQLATIDIAKAEVYLREAIDTIPQRSQELSVLGIANYGAGGETVDITDDLPLWLRRIAEKTARACELPVAGVDFLLAAEPTIASKIEVLDPVVIEVNKCPMLAMHDHPTVGRSRGAVAAYADYLASL